MGTVPKKIFPIEYAGFFDFNAEDVTDISLINAEETPNAKEIANEISKRYNAHEELVKALGDLYMDRFGGNSTSLKDALARSVKDDAYEQRFVKLLESL